VEQAVIRGQTTVTLGDQIRARWHSSTKYLMLLVAVFLAAMTLNSFRGALHSPLPQTETALVFAFMAVGMAIMIALFIAFLWGVIVLYVALSRLRLRKEQLAIAYAFGPDGIELRDGRGVTMTTPWTVVATARERKAAIRLSLRPLGSRYVIKRAFTPDDLRALRARLTQKLGPKAKLRPA
jgi:hypothetical protein